MIKINLVTLGFLIMLSGLLVSCQKEISHEISTNPTGGGTGGGGTGGGGTGTSTLLSKIVTKDITDSIIENFTYNSQNKLIAYSVKGETVADERDERYTFERDTQGRIIKRTELSTEDAGVTYDTIVTNVYYTATTGATIAYTISTSNSTDIDSAAFVYTGNKISKITSYEKGTSTYSVSDEAVYTFDANGNVTNVKYYDLSAGAPQLVHERKYTYDTKVSPLQLGSDEGILAIEYFAGPNNLTKFEVVDSMLGGLGNIILTSTFTYGTNNKPTKSNVSATLMGIPLPIGITSTYYY
jgi:hypothetical protein